MRHPSSVRGFSTIQLVIVLAIITTVAAAAMVGGERANENKRASITLDRMAYVEDILQGFKAAYGRLPCPASGQFDAMDATEADKFGVEAENVGNCTGGANISSDLGPESASGNVVAGVIPTKSLQIDDQYMYDGWGNRFTYFVDRRATESASCVALDTGAIRVKDTAGEVSEDAMGAIISHGLNGHGAFPTRGSSAENRINKQSADVDEQDNASADAAFADDFNAEIVKKEATATFDDVVRLQKTCCVGGICEEREYVGPELYVGAASSAYFTSYMLNAGADSFTLNTTPIVSNQVVGVAASGDNNYVAVASTIGLYVYQRNGTDLTQVYSLEGGINTPQAVAISQDSNYVALGQQAAGGTTLYKKSNDTYVPIADPTPQLSAAESLDFSDNGVYLAVANSGAERIAIYKRSGDNFIKLTGGSGPQSQPGAGAVSIDFSPDSNYVALGHQQNTLSVYARSGDVFTASAVNADANAYLVKFSSSGQYLAASIASSPYLTIYKRSGGSFSADPSIDSAPHDAVQGMAWSHDDTYLAVSCSSAPYLIIYKRNGDDFEILPNPADQPAGYAKGLEFRH